MTFEQSKSTSGISPVCARTLRDTAMMSQALKRSRDDLVRDGSCCEAKEASDMTASTLVGVSALAQPHFLIEVEAVAVID
ncbi:MAG: hypothetical protein WB807_09420 [Candidatus Dormiibacterota bacterium]